MKRVVIVGRPNVGKSTLFNRLAGKRRALIHDFPGMTRERLSHAAVLHDRPPYETPATLPPPTPRGPPPGAAPPPLRAHRHRRPRVRRLADVGIRRRDPRTGQARA